MKKKIKRLKIKMELIIKLSFSKIKLQYFNIQHVLSSVKSTKIGKIQFELKFYFFFFFFPNAILEIKD